MIDGLLRKHLRGRRAGVILDVGPGYGSFSRVAAVVTGVTKVVYVDCDKSVLEWQAKECHRSGIDSEQLEMVLDAERVTTIPGTYDVILCQEVLEHLVDAEGILQALTRRLSPEGCLVITVPTRRSERWLKRINPDYMNGEPHGHVREFDEPGLRALLDSAGLEPRVLVPTQPHYFVRHTWVFGTRMRVEGSTGQILTQGFRRFITARLTDYSRRFFLATGSEFWSRVLARNYFVVAVPAR